LWREDLKDISTRFYYLIACIRSSWQKSMWKTVCSMKKTISGLYRSAISLLILTERKQQRKSDAPSRRTGSIRAFREFKNDNEVGGLSGPVSTEPAGNPAALHGVGCSNGIVTGRARVIDHVSELHTIKPGDILVTHFTDTGWTSKFTVIRGIVTEFGGALCHAAIVAREYGIPCIVSCENVTRKIRDGSTITINGATGEVHIMEIMEPGPQERCI
jgi:pyruvate,water dikinase